ncbi:MAG: bifunctional folylpolyglutamate synthase/dihydrofolate synthase [Deltaproteobacteria bacterium]|nr:bifunctional folylpolyglutamate synthase/dihydrofolate synthase [Deltaproteobacteria bacterium]
MTKLEQFLNSWDQEYRQMRLGLERIQSVLTTLENPEKAYTCILIAGTNGKGSVAHMLESILLEAGYHVGLATSPHLHKINERIRIDGKPAENTLLEKSLEFFEKKNLVQGKVNLYSQEGEKLSWFEKMTALTLESFRQAKIEIAIIEVGLGGRFDATNAIEPTVSVITSVDFDHCEILGNSIFEIAREKAGIMRPQTPVIIGNMADEVRNFLNLTARILKAIPIRPFAPKGNSETFFYRNYEKLKLGLLGEYQLDNAATVIEAITALQEKNFDIPELAIKQGLEKTQVPGRLEKISEKPTIILDVAHNPQAIRSLANFLIKNFPEKKITFLLGMFKEKNVIEVLKTLKPLAAQWVISEVHSSRTVKQEDWKRFLSFDDLKIDAKIFKDPQLALQHAIKLTDEKDLVVATGSFYLVGEIRKEFLK